MDEQILLVTESALKERDIYESLSHTYRIKVMNSLEECYDSMVYFRPDLIIIDERTSGFECKSFVNEIHKHEGYETIPIFVLTATLKRAHERSLIAAGATDVVREPIEEEALKKQVHAVRSSSATKGKVSTLFKPASLPKTSSSLSDRLVIDSSFEKKVQASEGKMSLLVVELKEEIENFTTTLKGVIRKQDEVSKIDSKHYVILLPKTSQTAAECIAENIQEALHDAASIGLASAETNSSHLIQQAMTCLEEAKTKGNSIVSKIIKS